MVTKLEDSLETFNKRLDQPEEIIIKLKINYLI